MIEPAYQNKNVALYLGDCLAVLPTLEAGSVDAVITDPPYPGLKGGLELFSNGGVAKVINKTISVGDLWSASLEWIDEAWRVCKYGMMVFLFLS